MADDLWDAPNQQVVRPDASHPSQEGEGGSQPAEPKPRLVKAKPAAPAPPKADG